MKNLILSAYKKATQNGSLPLVEITNIVIEKPKDSANGDISTSFALAASKLLGKNPRDIANIIIENIDLSGSYFKDINIAGPGFINASFNDKWFSKVITDITEQGMDYGKAPRNGEKIMVEFVSANPTGSMHIGNARGGVLGDTLAQVLHQAGYAVTREFYINDAGNQVDLFGKSMQARYRQFKGEDIEFPENGYHGDDIKELTKKYIASIDDPDTSKMIEFGLENNINKMKADLAKYNITYDIWFCESSLYKDDYVRETINLLTKNGKTYEKEGAIWLKCTDFGLEKDDVLMRANGFYTYFAADIAYHRNKLSARGFDKVINIWGADHHGHVARLKFALDALGLNGSERLEVILMQLVKLVRDGETVKMSKRTGKSITLSDLLDDISVDCARFYFNMRKADSHLDFDLDLAVSKDSENPLYYVQYAHARICSILASGANGSNEFDISLLSSPEERSLIKLLSEYPSEIQTAATSRDPSKINKYVFTLAAAFHKFYVHHKVLADDIALKNSRLTLCNITKTVIGNSLNLLGVSAPTQM